VTPARAAWLAVRAVVVGVAAVRLARAARRSPPVAPAGDVVAPGTISVVVPARDEVHRIAPGLEALRADPAVAEVVVVDDHSTDATAELARALGARVLVGSPLPDGWAGKPWALQQGLEAATGEWVVCLDADVVAEPGLAAALAARCDADNLDLATAGGRFACADAAQQVLHPALLTTLVYRFGPAGAPAPAPHRLLANGQCLVARRRALLAAGGLAPVASSLVEDVALARHLAAAGWRVGLLDATGHLLVRGYRDAADAWRGWGRSLPLADVTSRPWLAADLAVVWLAQALPLVRLVLGRADAVDVVALALRAGTLVGTRRAYDRPGLWYWASPLADAAAAARLTQAALRPERRWRGRTYPRVRTAAR
jgi:dolichol-phosphate mannosyltransferase